MLSYYAFGIFGVLFSLIYTVLPLPEGSVFSIDVMILLFTTWCFLSPKTVPTLFLAWCLGLLQDVLLGSVLGEHAFALTITMYMLLNLLRRLKFYALWQQVLCVGCLTLINQLLIAIIEASQNNFASIFIVLSPAIMNMALWLVIGYAIFRHQDEL
jgi:rod shape-determining protein MreD